MANEGLSVLENLALAGVPFPRRIRQALEQLRDRNDEPPDEDAGGEE
ncbi:MAG: phage holin family protein [Aristaeellaceae bacterium]